ncbi:MAG: hypothetical protein LBM13_03670 [Candidatus Ancillula sp.]|jgi:hypothetical protein|nr:hypothetical protein [Candidatus Ancillula sp.]
MKDTKERNVRLKLAICLVFLTISSLCAGLFNPCESKANEQITDKGGEITDGFDIVSQESKVNLEQLVKEATNKEHHELSDGERVSFQIAPDLIGVQGVDKSPVLQPGKKAAGNCGTTRSWYKVQNILKQTLIEFDHNYTYCHPQNGVTEITSNVSEVYIMTNNFHDQGHHVAVDPISQGQKNVRARFRAFSEVPVLQYLGLDLPLQSFNIVHEDQRGVNGRIWEGWWSE